MWKEVFKIRIESTVVQWKSKISQKAVHKSKEINQQ